MSIKNSKTSIFLLKYLWKICELLVIIIEQFYVEILSIKGDAIVRTGLYGRENIQMWPFSLTSKMTFHSSHIVLTYCIRANHKGIHTWQ